jgi:uncharacterized protein YecT (DUF1311 family)
MGCEPREPTSQPATSLSAEHDHPECSIAERKAGPFAFRECWQNKVGSERKSVEALLNRLLSKRRSKDDAVFNPETELEREFRNEDLVASQTYWWNFVQKNCAFVAYEDGLAGAGREQAITLCLHEELQKRDAFLKGNLAQ